MTTAFISPLQYKYHHCACEESSGFCAKEVKLLRSRDSPGQTWQQLLLPELVPQPSGSDLLVIRAFMGYGE